MAISSNYDVVIIGAGGAGLMCAIEAGKRGRKVLVVDHAEKVGKKILISGGGRCNFTNLGACSEQYQSENKHFCKSAFGQFDQHDFISMVEKYGIQYHEKKLGQQFCDESAQQIVDMLLAECEKYNVEIKLNTQLDSIEKGEGFSLRAADHIFQCESLVVATGGLSIPKMGATGFGYKVAQQFGLAVTETTPALVPFTFSQKDLELYEGLSGISFDASVSCKKMNFRENVLITHRGVSGPAILQISSYWKAGDEISIHILPDLNWLDYIKEKRSKNPRQELKSVLCEVLPKRFVLRLFEARKIENKPLGQLSDKAISQLELFFTNYIIKPNGTEGYRKAEVTLGGVSTGELSAKTLEAKKVSGLYFVGEVVDVTGWLGGYNFQWAWSSGFSAGQVV